MTPLLLASASQLVSAVVPEPVHLAALIAAYALAFARLFDSARWAWNWAPPALQPILPALLAFATDLASGMGGANSYMDIAQAVIIDLGPLATAIRGALPAAHFDRLDEESKKALKAVRSGKMAIPRESYPPSSAAGMVLVILAAALGMGQSSCTKQQTTAVASAVANIVTEAILRSSQATEILNIVESKIDAAGLPPDVDRKVRQALAAARAANTTALAAIEAGEKTVAAADRAFGPFRDEWGNLMVLLSEAGLAQAGSLKAGPGEVTVPTPLALKPFKADGA